jgi:hypothetical protein
VPLRRGTSAFQFAPFFFGGGLPPKPFYLFSPPFFGFFLGGFLRKKENKRKNYKDGEKNTELLRLYSWSFYARFARVGTAYAHISPVTRLRHLLGMPDYRHYFVEYHKISPFMGIALCSLGFGALHP